MRLDYLSCWVDSVDVSNGVRVRPRNGLEVAYELPQCVVMRYLDPERHREHGWFVQASGEDAELVARELHKSGQKILKVTRADWCFDDVKCSPRDFRAAHQEGRVITRAREWSYMENGKGETFNIGKRCKRGYMVRLYNMRGFNRLEYEVHGARADMFLRAYLMGEDIKDHLAGLVRVGNGDDPRPTRQTIADWFKEAVSGVAVVTKREWQRAIEASVKAFEKLGHWVEFMASLGVEPQKSGPRPSRYAIWQLKQTAVMQL